MECNVVQPVHVLDGEGDLNILLIAGTHGNEITPLKCLANIVHGFVQIDKKYYRKLVIASGVNTPALRVHEREYSPKPTVDLNRSLNRKKSVEPAGKRKNLPVTFCGVLWSIVD